jgi:hypothetical protein
MELDFAFTKCIRNHPGGRGRQKLPFLLLSYSIFVAVPVRKQILFSKTHFFFANPIMFRSRHKYVTENFQEVRLVGWIN